MGEHEGKVNYLSCSLGIRSSEVEGRSMLLLFRH